MAWPIYSERILETRGNVIGWVRWNVPAGMRCVVRQLSTTNYAGTENYVQVAVAGTAVYGRQFPAADAGRQEEARWTAYAGEEVAIYIAAIGMAVLVNGFLFDDPGGRSGALYESEPLPVHDLEPGPTIPPAWRG